VVLGEHIVDFLAPACRLVVEVDGTYHGRRLRADDRRDARLQAMGYRVLHLEAELVMRELPVALALVRGCAGQLPLKLFDARATVATSVAPNSRHIPE
jgi:very-short-patch-repair endonuclease